MLTDHQTICSHYCGWQVVLKFHVIIVCQRHMHAVRSCISAVAGRTVLVAVYHKCWRETGHKSTSQFIIT